MAEADSRDEWVTLLHAGKHALADGNLPEALELFQSSLRLRVHFKTLELIGEVHCLLGNFEAAIIPLAAATGLDRCSRAPALLAEALYDLNDFQSAKRAAEFAVERNPGYRRGKSMLEKAISAYEEHLRDAWKKTDDLDGNGDEVD